MDVDNDHYIVELTIDETSLPATSQEMLHERRVAIFDLLEENEFRPLESASGPYIVNLALQDNTRLIFDVSRSNGGHRLKLKLSIWAGAAYIMKAPAY